MKEQQERPGPAAPTGRPITLANTKLTSWIRWGETGRVYRIAKDRLDDSTTAAKQREDELVQLAEAKECT